VEMQSYI